MGSARKPQIENHGIISFHDQACAVLYDSESAVYDCNTGIFHPSWSAQRKGYQLVHAKSWAQRLALKIFFDVDMS